MEKMYTPTFSFSCLVSRAILHDTYGYIQFNLVTCSACCSTRSRNYPMFYLLFHPIHPPRLGVVLQEQKIDIYEKEKKKKNE